MKKDSFQPIDAVLNDVQSVLNRLMGAPKGYKLSETDLKELDVAEENLNKARSTLWGFVED